MCKDKIYPEQAGGGGVTSKRNAGTVVRTSLPCSVGDGEKSNYVLVNASTGVVELAGSARARQPQEAKGAELYGQAATYNGIVCAASSWGIWASKWSVHVFDDTSPEAAVINFCLSPYYEDGTSILVDLEWSTITIGGSVLWGMGLSAVGDGEDFNSSVEWNEVLSATPGVARQRVSLSATFSGTGMVAGNLLSAIVYRNAADASDDAVGDVYLVGIGVRETKNKLGGAVS